MVPLGSNFTYYPEAKVNNNTYLSGTGKTLIHLVNGQAGNIEAHSTLPAGGQVLNISQYLDQTTFGFSKLTVLNESMAYWEYVHGMDGSVGDHLYMVKGKI